MAGLEGVTLPSALITMLPTDCALIRGRLTVTNDVNKISVTAKAKRLFLLPISLNKKLSNTLDKRILVNVPLIKSLEFSKDLLTTQEKTWKLPMI